MGGKGGVDMGGKEGVDRWRKIKEVIQIRKAVQKRLQRNWRHEEGGKKKRGIKD